MKTATKKQTDKRGKGECLVSGCNRPQHTRGDCHSCYQMLQRAIKAGEITEEEAIAAGLILPARSESHSPMSAAIKSVKRKTNL